MIESWYKDFVLGLRGLRKRPVFAATAILTLALGIGANTAIFTLLYGLLLRSLPVSQPLRLVRVSLSGDIPGRGGQDFGLTWRMMKQLQLQQRSFTDISGWDNDAVYMRDSEGTLRMYPAGLVTGNGFQVLGVKPLLGRLLMPSDDVPGGPPQGWPVVLSYGFWNEHFARDPLVVGKRLEISNIPFVVAGVAPMDFQGVQAGERPQVYLPMYSAEALSSRVKLDAPDSMYGCQPIARLKPGVSLEQANAEIAVSKDMLIERFIPQKLRESQDFLAIHDMHLQATSGRSGVPFDDRSILGPLWLLQGLVAVVLLLCCVNVGGLMISRIHERRHEFAVRSAIGAGRWRLMRQYLTESFVIAAAGAALGALLAWNGSQVLLRFFLDPGAQWGYTVPLDRTVFLVTAVLALATTVLFGSVPAWLAGRSDLGLLLKSRTLAGRKQIAGRAFVPAQVALSLVLVAVAGLLSESLIRMRSERLGFDVDHITLTCPQFQDLPQKGDAILDLYQRMVDRLNESPGILSAAITYYTPLTNHQATSDFQAMSGGPTPPEDKKMAWNDVGPGYFRTMKIGIVAGREFERQERHRDRCVLNQSAADYLFPHQQALGQYVRSVNKQQFSDGISCLVVGIAEDAKYASLRERPPRTIYFPMNSSIIDRGGNMVFLMRSQHEAEAIAAYRKALAENAPTTALLRFATLRQQMDDSVGAPAADHRVVQRLRGAGAVPERHRSLWLVGLERGAAHF